MNNTSLFEEFFKDHRSVAAGLHGINEHQFRQLQNLAARSALRELLDSAAEHLNHDAVDAFTLGQNRGVKAMRGEILKRLEKLNECTDKT